MNISIDHRPAYAIAKVRLEAGEAIRAESGAMLAMHDVTISTSSGGLFKAAKRKFFGGESFFLNEFHAGSNGGEVLLAPQLPGDVVQLNLDGRWTVQGSSYLAGDTSLDIDTNLQSLTKGFFSGEGLFMLGVRGRGALLLSSFGAIHEVEVNGEYIVDTGHIVAFEEGLDYRIRGMGNWMSTLFSGEGLVCRFQGRGRLLLQTRQPEAYGKRIGPLLPERREVR